MATRALTKPMLTPPLFDDFFKPWNEWFNGNESFNRMMTMPPVNITENGNNYSVSLAVPGLKKEDFKVDIEGNMLTISSEKEETKEETGEKFNRKEYSYSTFSRSFTLPDDVKQDGIEAKYEDGVLKIKLPRKENGKKHDTTRKVVVK